jgi:hypothetical protein
MRKRQRKRRKGPRGREGRRARRREDKGAGGKPRGILEKE